MYHKFLFYVIISTKIFHLFMHFYAASFSIKKCFLKNDNVSYLENYTHFLKTESSIKICHIAHTFHNFAYFRLKFVICKQNKDFCMETRSCNHFKIANAVTLDKAILEIPYKVLQGLWKEVIFKRVAQFSKAIQF